MILFLNACTRKSSRTRRLAEELLRLRREEEDADICELELYSLGMKPVDEAVLLERSRLVAAGETDECLKYARLFKAADEIIIAAPFWDMSFPAVLKLFIEQVSISGVTFVYGEDGMPSGLCRAGRLSFVTTAGGRLFKEYGFDYIDCLARRFFGIPEVRLYYAEGLDILGCDERTIMDKAINAMRLAEEHEE